MPTPFATLESRLNQAVFARLANKSATLAQAGVPPGLDDLAVTGIFDKAFELGSVGIGMASTQPVFTMATSAITGEPVGQTLTVDGVTYLIVAHEPDGSGISRLLLEASA